MESDVPVALDAGSMCPADPPLTVAHDPLAKDRGRCAFSAGARVLDTLGMDSAARAGIPIDHLVIVMQENRSFDHYLGRMPQNGRPDVDGIPDGYVNLDTGGRPVVPQHLASTCAPGDPPHQWSSMHVGWNNGLMDGFFRSAVAGGGHGRDALGYYEARDLPFYYWLYGTFAMSDRYFAATLGGTWANRNFLYSGGAYGVHDTGTATIEGVPTVYDQMDAANVSWGVYTDGPPRQDTLGWTPGHAGLHGTRDLFAGLHHGDLPAVVFVDPSGPADEHPVSDIQHGEAWTRGVLTAAMASPLWPRMAVVVTYDESGGFFDHVPPPEGCVPAPGDEDFDRRGMRVPMVVVSPWSRPGYVSHVVHDHTSILRLIELLHDLPALTARDANADALLDLFDFSCPHFLRLPAAPPHAGTGGCVTR